MNREHPTSNIEHPTSKESVDRGCWVLDVRCWMFFAFGSGVQCAIYPYPFGEFSPHPMGEREAVRRRFMPLFLPPLASLTVNAPTSPTVAVRCLLKQKRQKQRYTLCSRTAGCRYR
jgi:hypothetical protein